MVTTILTFRAARYVLFSGPLLALAFAPSPLAALGPRIGRWVGRIGLRGLALAAIAAVMLRIPTGTRILRPGWLEGTFPSHAGFPVQATRFLVDHECRGRVFNDYGWGAYMAWVWKQPVGVYSAADALGEKNLADFIAVESLRTDPSAYMRKYAISFMVMPTASAIARWAFDHGWTVLHVDPVAIVLAAPGSAPCRQ